MADDSAHFFGDTLHVLENLLELGNELTLGWLESHIFGSKADGGVDTVLLLVVLLVHFSEDKVSTLLVDPNLGFHNHVVNKSDESTKTVIVSLGKLENSVFELIFLLLEYH